MRRSSLQFVTLVAFGFLFAFASTLHAEEPVTIRVLTYNIHHGEGNDGKFDLERLGKVIAAQKPDLVALQEVDVNTGRSRQTDQLKEIQRHSGLAHGAFFEAMPYDGGSYGEAILSRWPIVSQERIGLPSLNNGEPRALGRVDVAIGASEDKDDTQANFVFFATHLDHRRDEQERIASAEKINEIVTADESGLPMLLAGDLNATPQSKPIQTLLSQWTAAKEDGDFAATFPATNPRRAIDYVMYRGPGTWTLKELKVVDEPVASDHCPVLVVLEWTGN